MGQFRRVACPACGRERTTKALGRQRLSCDNCGHVYAARSAALPDATAPEKPLPEGAGDEEGQGVDDPEPGVRDDDGAPPAPPAPAGPPAGEGDGQIAPITVLPAARMTIRRTGPAKPAATPRPAVKPPARPAPPGRPGYYGRIGRR